MNAWLIIIVGGLLTFAMRFSFIYFFGRVEIPAALRRSLRFVPPAVLSAIILPELLLPAGQLDLSLGNHRWLAGLVAVLVALAHSQYPPDYSRRHGRIAHSSIGLLSPAALPVC